MTRIGFLGPRGTFSEEALNQYTAGRQGFLTVDFSSIPDILTAVKDGRLEEAVVPIENSLEGAVSATMDILAFDVDLTIRKEMVLPIRQNLLVRKNTAPSDIQCILSHPQPIGQCRRYLNTTFPEAVVKLSLSTAAAAEEVAHGDGHSAAIGAASAAAVYGLEILAAGIQDAENNMTRFVIISKEKAPRSGTDKTSIVFSTDDRPGSLYRVLDIFNLWDINLTRIESRPAKNQLGRYIFFVDITGHVEDSDVRDALTMVKRKTSFYKFLGSYPVFSPQ